MRKFFIFFIPYFLLLSCSKVFLAETKAVVLLSLNVSKETAAEGIILKWTSQWDFATFDIYRGQSPKDLSLFRSNVVQTSWIDEDTVPGYDYFYKIVAYNNSGRMIGESLVLSGKRSYPSFDKVEAPEDLKASVDQYSDKVELYWVGGSKDRFRIYRADDESGPYQQIAETGGIFYTDKTTKPASTYYYKITAVGVDSDGNIKERDMIGNPQMGRTLDAPQGLSASKNSRKVIGGIELSWVEDKTVEYYKVYRSVSSDENYTIIAPFVLGNSYIDRSLPDLQGRYEGSDFKYPSYFYKIVAVKNGQDSGASPEAEGSALNPNDLLPAPQVTVKINKSTYPYKVEVSWSLGNSARSANLTYLLSKKEGNRTLMAPIYTDALSYTLENEPLGSSVEYVVQAINADAGNLPGEEGSSVYQSLTPAPPVIKTITTNARSYVTNKVESTNIQTYIYWYSGFFSKTLNESMVGAVEKWWKITSTVGNIDLTWEKKEGSETIDSYNVYRKAPGENQYRKINNAPIAELSYTDTNFTDSQYSGRAVNGRFAYPMYSYKITAVANGNESILSEVSREGSAINPKDLLKAPDHLGVPFHWASGTGWGNYSFVRGSKTSTGNKDLNRYAYGIDQVPNPPGRYNFLYLVWSQRAGVTHYQVRHSLGSALEDWYTHPVSAETRRWFNNETRSPDKTGLYVFSDFSGYSRESVGFEVTSVNQNAGGLLGDTIGIWFSEPTSRPKGF